MYGSERLLDDLIALGYQVEIAKVGDNSYAVISDYEVMLGRFKGRKIDLGILAPPDYPKSVASAIHVRVNPQLFEKSDTLANVRNITDSQLGTEWRYWSKNFNWNGEKTTRRLLSQINKIFNDA
jgi:hypothetical protein